MLAYALAYASIRASIRLLRPASLRTWLTYVFAYVLAYVVLPWPDLVHRLTYVYHIHLSCMIPYISLSVVPPRFPLVFPQFSIGFAPAGGRRRRRRPREGDGVTIYFFHSPTAFRQFSPSFHSAFCLALLQVSPSFPPAFRQLSARFPLVFRQLSASLSSRFPSGSPSFHSSTAVVHQLSALFFSNFFGGFPPVFHGFCPPPSGRETEASVMHGDD